MVRSLKIASITDTFNLKPGMMLPLQETIQRARLSTSMLSMPPEEHKEKIPDGVLGQTFDVIDTNKQGYIYLVEAKAFYKIIAPKAEVLHC